MKKKLFALLLFIVLSLASCSDETDVENGTAQNEETNEKCGDGTCDTAEQEDATLCPIDCTPETTEEKEEASASSKTSPAPSSGSPVSTEDTSSYPSLSEEFTFLADEGLRMTEASNPGARVNDDGTISLLYEDHTGDSPAQYVATSEEGLLFSDRGERVSN